LKEVDGVGPKRAEQIWLTLNGLHFQREVETTLTVSHLGTNTPETL
jgi:Holliday junction resolvasome RuvABC DNA-binding subunit